VANKALRVPVGEKVVWIIAVEFDSQSLTKDTGSYRARPQFVIKISRGTLKVKKEDRWKRYRWERFRRDSRRERRVSWLVVVANKPWRWPRVAVILAACALLALANNPPRVTNMLQFVLALLLNNTTPYLSTFKPRSS
jgi:hypothetical protein